MRGGAGGVVRWRGGERNLPFSTFQRAGRDLYPFLLFEFDALQESLDAVLMVHGGIGRAIGERTRQRVQLLRGGVAWLLAPVAYALARFVVVCLFHCFQLRSLCDDKKKILVEGRGRFSRSTFDWSLLADKYEAKRWFMNGRLDPNGLTQSGESLVRNMVWVRSYWCYQSVALSKMARRVEGLHERSFIQLAQCFFLLSCPRQERGAKFFLLCRATRTGTRTLYSCEVPARFARKSIFAFKIP